MEYADCDNDQDLCEQGSGNDEEEVPDLECKRAMSFSARNFKRPPDLNIELIAHSSFPCQEIIPLQDISAVSFKPLVSGIPDGTKDRENLRPLSPIVLSPLAMPVHFRSLASTPIMLNSFTNVFKNETESYES